MDIPTKIQQHKRKGWKPIATEGDGAVTASKFSGRPWLAKGELWPVCPNCENPMQLFLQLNLSELPEMIRGQHGDGLLQMYYCTNQEPLCEVDCQAYFPFSKSTLLRIVDPSSEPEQSIVAGPADVFPAATITAWKELDDYPSWQERDEMGISETEAERESMSDYPLSGDKLGGWPMWVQGIEYPNCPQCHERMELLFQIDSEDNIPYMFGDVGCGHITQCRTHKDQLAFGWACG